MNCQICLKESGKSQYHSACLKTLFGSSKVATELAETRAELVREMPKKTKGFSISGVQIKAQLKVEDESLKLVDHDGDMILKPSPESYPYVAENEHLTLVLMQHVGFDVPSCGLIALKDGHRVFVIRRYDRTQEGKVHQEDAMQALGLTNDASSSKYESATYAQVLELTRDRCGTAVAARLLDRLVFSYLVGNDDHHLKNISFILGRPITLAPAYDVLAARLYNTGGPVMALKFFTEREPAYYAEMGNGHYSGADFVELAKSAGLGKKAATNRVGRLAKRVQKAAPDLIKASYMPDDMKAQYQALISERLNFIQVM